MSQQVLKTVSVVWKCNKPSARRFPGLVDFCETTVKSVAQKLDRDQAIIRAEPHRTTRRNGELVNIQNHITADFVDSATGVGEAAHIYLSDDNTKMLESTAERPNPETWPLPKAD